MAARMYDDNNKCMECVRLNNRNTSSFSVQREKKIRNE